MLTVHARGRASLVAAAAAAAAACSPLHQARVQRCIVAAACSCACTAPAPAAAASARRHLSSSAVPPAVSSSLAAASLSAPSPPAASSSDDAPAAKRACGFIPPTSTAALRAHFGKFFQSRSHMLLPSSGLVPAAGDESLLFTNAGMVPLKDMLLGVAPAPPGSEGRLASVQKCVRAGGKHNDLENVGHTARHHTFFEMLGNFSIGAYFKLEAMALAWTYLTKELRLPEDRLRITVLHNDDESARMWQTITGFTEASGKIVRMGEADNFWSMGDAPGTPCGPCSEIFYDQLTEVDGERFLEIWNLVFMQYERGAAPGELKPLSRPCVDTGMGLERIAAVMQGVPTNYDTDGIKPIILAVEELARQRQSRSKPSSSTSSTPALVIRPYTNGLDPLPQFVAQKVIVDHLRSSAFLIAEGVLPSNTGRGYVLRRIIRRAVRYGQQYLGLREPFMADLLPALQKSMGEAYPELIHRAENIKAVLTNEESAFFSTLSRGLAVLEEAFLAERGRGALAREHRPVLSGEVAFQLYDTFGFPLDLTQVIARERPTREPAAEGSTDASAVADEGWGVDVARFEQLMRAQREQSKGAAFQVGGSSSSAAASAPVPLPPEVKRWQLAHITNSFVGYDSLDVDNVNVVGVHFTPALLERESSTLWLALENNPFYANAGGQIGDVGSITLRASAAEGESKDAVEFAVVDCVKPYEGCSVLRVIVPPEHATLASSLQVGSAVLFARVSRSHRDGVAAHHTATHLLHAGLKAVLGAPALAPAAGSIPAVDPAAEDAAMADGEKKKSKKKSKDKSSSSAVAPVLTAASINQSGSLVSSDRLRFDFSFPLSGGLTQVQIAAVEGWVNEAILAAAREDEKVSPVPASASSAAGGSVRTQLMSKDEALAANAMALFGEKYGSVVRVVSIPGYSTELCGGTHVRHIRSCFPFKILSENGIATGVRRIEAVTGVAAIKYLESSHQQLRSVADALNCPPPSALASLQKLQQKCWDLEAQLGAAKKASLLEHAATRATRARWLVKPAYGAADQTAKQVDAWVHEISPDPGSDFTLVRECCAALSTAHPEVVHVLLVPSTGSVAVATSAELGSNDAPAKSVLARIQASLTNQGATSAGKGGGSAQVALGMLPITYAVSTQGEAEEKSLLQRVVHALADLDAVVAPAGKSKAK